MARQNGKAPPGARQRKGNTTTAAAVAAAEVVERGGAREALEWTLSTGVKVAITAAPANALQEAARRIPKPDPPMIMNEAKQREEPNADHPSHKLALEQWEYDQAIAAAQIAVLLGVKILEVPEGFARHDGGDDEWIDDLEYLMPEIKVDRDNERSRRIHWLRYHAARSNSDIAIVNSGPMMLAGVSEEDVAKSIASFRRLETRHTDLGVPADTAGGHGDGDRVSVDDPGTDTGDRGAGSGAIPPSHVGGVDGEGSPVSD